MVPIHIKSNIWLDIKDCESRGQSLHWQPSGATWCTPEFNSKYDNDVDIVLLKSYFLYKHYISMTHLKGFSCHNIVLYDLRYADMIDNIEANSATYQTEWTRGS